MNWKPLNRNISNISCWHSVFYWYLRTLFFLTRFKQAFFKPQNKSLGRLLRPCSFTNDDAALTKDTFDDCYFWKTHVAYIPFPPLPPKNILITTYIHIKVLRMFALIIFSYLDQQYVFNDQVYLSKTDKIKGQLSNIAKLNYN